MARVVNSIVEFKQIIGRGTRLCDEYGKYFFNILDFTQSTRLFADPEFDGDPVVVTEVPIDDEGNETDEETVVDTGEEAEDVTDEADHANAEEGDIFIDPIIDDEGGDGPDEPRKYYYDGGQVEIAAHLVYELDPEGHQLRVVKFTDYTAEKVRSIYRNAADLRRHWLDPLERNEIIEALAEKGIDFEYLAEQTNQPDADPLDLLCHIAFNAPLRTRRERADRLRTDQKDFFEQYGPQAKQLLHELLEKYTTHGTTQFIIPDILEVPPISEHGNVMDIIQYFGSVERLREAVNLLQKLLYAAV